MKKLILFLITILCSSSFLMAMDKIFTEINKLNANAITTYETSPIEEKKRKRLNLNKELTDENKSNITQNALFGSGYLKTRYKNLYQNNVILISKINECRLNRISINSLITNSNNSEGFILIKKNPLNNISEKLNKLKPMEKIIKVAIENQFPGYTLASKSSIDKNYSNGFSISDKSTVCSRVMTYKYNEENNDSELLSCINVEPINMSVLSQAKISAIDPTGFVQPDRVYARTYIEGSVKFTVV